MAERREREDGCEQGNSPTAFEAVSLCNTQDTGTTRSTDDVPLSERREKGDNEQGMTYDSLLTSIGEFGPYQTMVVTLLSFQDTNWAIQMVSTVFFMAFVPFRCAIPWLANDTWQIQGEGHSHLINLTIPPGDHDLYSNCLVYSNAENYFSNSTAGSYYGNGTGVSWGVWLSGEGNGSGSVGVDRPSDMDNATYSCDQYVYDTSQYTSTIVMELDLVCGRGMYRSHAQMMMMVGCVFGSQLSGLVSDMWGRKTSVMLFTWMNIIVMIVMNFVSHYVMLVILSFFVGLSALGCLCPGFVLGMEIVGPSRRLWVTVFPGCLFGVGTALVALLAYYLRDWHHLQVACTIGTLPYLAYWWLIPESPRWLLSKGRVTEAEKVLTMFARANKTTLPPGALDKLQIKDTPQVSLLGVFCSAYKLLGRHLIIFYSWFVASFTYFGLIYNVSSLGGDVYINVMVSGLMDIAALLMCVPLLSCIGRRPLNCVFFMVAGVTCIATLFPVIFLHQDYHWVTVVLSMVGKLAVAAAFSLMWLYSNELFPTVMRNSATGAGSLSARLGGIVAPYVANLAIHGAAGQAIPLIIFGVPAIVVSLLILCLPETFNRPLPDTVQDAIDMGRKKTEGKPPR